VLNAARQTGGAIGVALLGTVLASGVFVPGLHAAMAVAAGAFVAGALVTALGVDRDRRPEGLAGHLRRIPDSGVRHHGRG
jgi:MFS transporter, DHA2 family, methylenomycin A resistance protein